MRSYPAKLLLFGEYSVLQGGAALARPLTQYSARWAHASDAIDLTPLIDQLYALTFSGAFDYKHMQQELTDGLRLETTIPLGKGLGSSAALAAALYHRYCSDPPANLSVVKQDLATIEGLFHHQSSGFDALVSYLNSDLLIHSGQIKQVKLIPTPGQYRIYLLDTKKKRSTTHLVALFQEMMLANTFESTLKELSLLNSQVIESFMLGADFWAQLQTVSELQFTHMAPFILDELQPIWKKTLDEPNAILKLCGAGGGGFYLLFTRGLPSLERWHGFQLVLTNSN